MAAGQGSSGRPGPAYTRAMAAADGLDGTGLAAGLRAMLAALREHEDELNRLNVFPIPDHDTGTNLVHTMAGVVAAVEATGGRELADVAVTAAEAALLEARGNSGTILAEALRGLCQIWAPLGVVGPADLVRGFQVAADRADQAVLEPVQGTILSVVRATAEALAALPADDLGRLLAAAAEAAGRAVEATPKQLETLRRAGVVDAAGRGWELCLRALAAAAGGAPPEPEPAAGLDATAPRPTADDSPAPQTATAGYEVQYLVVCTGQDAHTLEGTLRAIGDSVTLVRGDGAYRVHVHTERPGPAIEAALRLGTLSRIEVTRLYRAPEGPTADSDATTPPPA
jgi:uncharacterized protein